MKSFRQRMKKFIRFPHCCRVLFLLPFLLLSQLSYGQFRVKFNKRNRYHSIGLNLNAINYVGDVDPSRGFLSPALRYTQPSIGIQYLYKWNPHLFFRASFSYGRIKGNDYVNAGYGIDDIYRKLRNITFRNDLIELKADFIYDLVGNFRHYRKRPEYVPYVFAGIAYFHHNPQGLSPSGQWVNLKPLSTEGEGLPGTGKKNYSLHQIAIPLGIGIRHRISRQLDFGFEIGWRFTFTDYLDDVSGNYVDRDLLRREKGNLAVTMADRTQAAIDKDPRLKDFIINRQGGFVNKNNQSINADNGYIYSYNIPGAQRGDGNKDWYVVTGFHLIYIIPPRVVCPKFRD